MKAPLILSTLLCCWHMAIAGTGYPNTEAMGDLADKQSEWYRACMAAEDALPQLRTCHRTRRSGLLPVAFRKTSITTRSITLGAPTPIGLASEPAPLLNMMRGC